jgi:pyruvate dehydrogenase (quinone)/pyruvate oxidase
MEECDSLLMVGTSFPYMCYLPEPDQAKAVQIDYDPKRLGLRFPIDVGLTGDAKATLQALMPLLRRKPDRTFLETAQKRVKEWWELLATRENREDTPIKPQVIAKHVNDLLADNAIISTDSGTITTWAARHLKIRRGMKFSCSGNLATMAPGLPYANAAQIAYPDRQVVAFVGDGGFTMLMMEFITAVKHNLPIKVIIIKNNTLGQIKWEQMVFLGNPEYGCDLQPIDFAAFARACGASGFTIEDPQDCGRILEEALGTDGPVVVQAVVDPFEPPMPPKVTLDQATKLAEALVRGEPNRDKIALTVMSDRVRELV